jgi:hypothetical protein
MGAPVDHILQCLVQHPGLQSSLEVYRTSHVDKVCMMR